MSSDTLNALLLFIRTNLNFPKELLVAFKRALNADFLVVEWTDAFRETHLESGRVCLADLVHIVVNSLW
jgi:hypothetical protein